MTFDSGFDDLGEDVVGDVVSALHGRLSVLDPLSSSCAQQSASFPHIFDERSVLWVVLKNGAVKNSVATLTSYELAKSYGEEVVSDGEDHPFQTCLDSFGET